MAFIDELMKLQGNQMGRTPVAPFPATPQATPQAPQGPQVQPQTPTDTIQPQTPTPQTGEGGNILSRGFDFFFGPPTPEQAQQTLTTQPTDPAQRENLQAIVRGEERPSSVGKAASFLFGRPDVAGDPNIMGATKPEAVAPQFGLADTTSSTAPTGEDPFSGPIVQPQVPQADPNQQIRLADPTSSTAGLNPTQAMLQERFGAPTISAIQAAPEGLGMRTDPQGRMIDPNADRSFFEQQSAAREQRAEEQFGVARGPDARDRDTGEMSMADAVDLAGGDREKARAMVVASRQTQGEVDDGLTPYQRANLAWQKQKFTAEQASKGLDRALKEAKSDEERTQIRQEMETKENDLYNLHQDSFDRQERYINQALENTGLLSTGFASISKFMPGTPARQLEESLKPILGEAAFGRLQQMRDASKTGGALGQVSERELGLLESAMGALSTSQNESQFRANLLAYRKQLRESHARIQEKYKEMRAGGSSGGAKPRYENDQDFADSAESYYNPSK